MKLKGLKGSGRSIFQYTIPAFARRNSQTSSCHSMNRTSLQYN